VKWLKRFAFVYQYLYPKYVLLACEVYETKHGYHIELELSGRTSAERVNLFECLFYSDLNKQLVGFVENSDVLFARKNGHERVRKFDLERSVGRMAELIMSNPKYVKNFVVNMK
jgi:hypothetical protein